MSIEFIIVENDSKGFQTAMDAEMNKCIKHFEGELVKIRTGRAHTSMVENILVTCYGQPAAPMKNFAAIAAPDARLITIQPWDATTLSDIERAINSSDIGVKPANDGAVIKLVLPEMSASRREELVKVLHDKLEQTRTAVRNVRKDFQNIIRDAKKNKTISEDFSNRLADVLQNTTDNFIKKAEQMASKKQTDLTTV